ncbi:MAG: PEP-CTERM sorting domain-containing protein [Xanthomonadales bacterium]|nr:PEP-CTERM sorting domain-containing protein [Xanthomonadales bacterium]
MRATTLFVTLFAPVLVHAAPVNLLTNGSFEDVNAAPGIQSQAANSWAIYNSLPGWNSTNGIEVRNNVAGTAQDGSSFVELDTTRNSIAMQTVSTQAGTWYDLSFWYAARPNTGGRAGDTNQISAYWNGLLLGLFNQAPTAQHQWVEYSFSVLGTGTDTVEFRALGTSDGYGGSLDNVRLSVPEPGSLALVLGALAASVGLRRRSQRS